MKDRGRFVLTIHWDSSEGHMKRFRKSEHFQPFYALVAPFYGQIEEMEHYEPTGNRVVEVMSSGLPVYLE